MRPFSSRFKPTSITADSITKKNYWVSTCVDPRLTSKNLEYISQKIFDAPFNPLFYSYRTAGTENKSTDKSTQNLINAMKKTSELQDGENFILMVHDDCFAVKSGVVETKKSGTYFDHLQEQVAEMLKNDDFKAMVKNGKLDFVAALYSHNPDKTKPDNVQSFKIKISSEDQMILEPKKEFPIQKSDSKSKTEGYSR